MTRTLPLSRFKLDGRPMAGAPVDPMTVSRGRDIDPRPTFDTLLEALSWNSRRTTPAILAPGRTSLTHASLFREVERAGASLAAMGLGRGSRIALALPSGPEMAVALLGVASYAAVAPLDPATEEGAWKGLLESLRIDAVVVPDRADSAITRVARELRLQIVRLGHSRQDPAGCFELFSDARRPAVCAVTPFPNDVAMLLRTSGTVSAAKVVPLTQSQMVARPRRVLLNSSDRCLCMSPLFTATALGTNLLAALMEGISVVIPPEFSGDRFLDWVDEFKPTYLTATATMLASLVEIARQRKLPVPHSLRFLRSTSNALPKRLQQELEEVFGIPVIQAYSMTETGAISENPLPPAIRKLGSVGLPVAEIAIMSETESLKPGESGDIMVRGPRLMSGYENNPQENAIAFRDGWFRTGDQGYLDEDGYLFLTGRTKELINRGGVKISPHEIDEVLLRHPAVKDAAAFSLPHPTLGEDVAAAVVLRTPGSVTQKQLRSFCLERLTRSKAPSTIVYVDDLVRNSSGKVVRNELSATLGAALSDAQREIMPPQDAIEVQLMRVWEQLLGRYPIGVTDDFFELGGDSLLAAQAIDRMNQLFGQDVPADILWHGGRTVETLAAELRERARQSSPLWSRAVPFRSGGSRRPLFCTPVEGGHLFFYDNVARHLNNDQPVYGLPAQGTDGREPPHVSIEAMAAHAIGLMREVQPAGPYALLGYCSGALVAFEMARQLEMQGDEIARLVLVDSVAPGVNLRSWWLLALDAANGRNPRLLQERLYQLVLRSLGLGRFRRLTRLGEAHRWARWSYRAGSFNGPAILIRPSRMRSSRDRALGWRRWVRGGVEIREVAGSHGALVTVSGAPKLAAELEPWLQ